MKSKKSLFKKKCRTWNDLKMRIHKLFAKNNNFHAKQHLCGIRIWCVRNKYSGKLVNLCRNKIFPWCKFKKISVSPSQAHKTYTRKTLLVNCSAKFLPTATKITQTVDGVLNTCVYNKYSGKFINSCIRFRQRKVVRSKSWNFATRVRYNSDF